MIPLVMFILPVIVPGLNALHTGQKYKVVLPQQIHALYKSDTQDKYPHVVKYELQIEEEPLVIHLERNAELIADNYMETSYDQDDKPTMISPKENKQDHCHYQGYVENDNQSMASISTCSGISGIIVTKGQRYLIEPQNLADGMHIVYEEEKANPKACAVTGEHRDGSVVAQQVLPTMNQKEIDDLMNAPKFIEMAVVADLSMYRKYGNNTKSVKDKVFAIMNVFNMEFKILNISAVLVAFEIWDTKDYIKVDPIVSNTLRDFSIWRMKNFLPRVAHDNAQFITNTNFANLALGLGNVESICREKYSTAVIKDHSSSPVYVAATSIHEASHNLGINHDNESCSCPEEFCIMSPFLSLPPSDKFSQCSINQFKTILLKMKYQCLMNKPGIERIISPPFCGNNLIENGEQCDCGDVKQCTNPCCDASTCKLKPGAVCADGECCEKCKFKEAGSICQKSLHECDLPDTCDGKSNRCLDLFQKDGSSCMNGQGYCLHGKCPTMKQQCIDLWSSDALVGDDQCFDFNLKGKPYGYCTQSGNTYLPCLRQDMKCGVLFCYGGNNYPNVIANSATINSCKAVLDPSGMVQNGTRCAEEKVCYMGACTSKDIVYKSLACNTECPGQVICNQAGQCYCKEEQPIPKCAISGV